MLRPRVPPTVRRLGLVLAIPLLLVATGVWQFLRAGDDAIAYRDEAAGLDQVAARLAPRAAMEPFAIMRIGDQSVGLAYGLILVRQAADRLRTDVVVARARGDVAIGTAAGGTLALLASAFGLVTAAHVRRRIRASRAELVAHFTRIRSVLPGFMIAQVAGLLLALICATVFETAGLWGAGLVANVASRLLIAGIAVIGALVWFGWVTIRRLRQALAAFELKPEPRMARSIDPAAAPGLFALINGVVARQRALAPDHVMVGLLGGFSVTAFPIELLPSGHVLRGRLMYLPIAQAAMLSVAEITAILAHELAHFAGQDTDYSLRVAPIYHGIGRALAAVDDGTNPFAATLLRPASSLGLHMLGVFADAVGHWSRVREFAADAAAVDGVAPVAVASALIRTGLLPPLMDETMAQAWRHPRTAPADLVAEMVARAEATGFGAAAARIEERQPHPTDSHPPTRQRIDALGVAVDDALLARGGRVVTDGEVAMSASLFADWPGLCAALSADALLIALRHDQTVEASLREAASIPALEACPILEDVRGAMVAYGLAALCGLGFACFLAYVLAFWTLAKPNAATTLGLALVGSAIVGVLGSTMLVRRLRRRGTPFLTLTTSGFTCRHLDGTVAWSDVDRFGVVGGRTVVTTFGLGEAAPLPRRVTGYRARVSTRRRRIILTGLRPRGLTPQAYSDLVWSYINAARAREALAARADGP